MKTLECPCCGQQVSNIRLLTDTITNTVTTPEGKIKLTPKEMDFLVLMMRKYPEIATKEAVWETVFMEPNGDGPELKIVDVFVCKMRKKLSPLGIVIETFWGRGYRLVESDPARAQEIVNASLRRRAKGTRKTWQPDHDDKLLRLVKSGHTLTHCATVLKMPYAAVDKRMRALREQHNLI